jgi:hypothetical protein
MHPSNKLLEMLRFRCIIKLYKNVQFERYFGNGMENRTKIEGIQGAL